MIKVSNFFLIPALLLIFLMNHGCRGPGQTEKRKEDRRFSVIETTIADIHRAFQEKEVTCRRLVRIYLKRIEMYDQSSGLNSIPDLEILSIKQSDSHISMGLMISMTSRGLMFLVRR